jgi:hypothetical protein
MSRTITRLRQLAILGSTRRRIKFAATAFALVLVSMLSGCQGLTPGYNVTFHTNDFGCVAAGVGSDASIKVTINVYLFDWRTGTRDPVFATVTSSMGQVTPATNIVADRPSTELHNGNNPVVITYTPGLNLNYHRDIFILTVSPSSGSGQNETITTDDQAQVYINPFAGGISTPSCSLSLISSAHPRPTAPVDLKFTAVVDPAQPDRSGAVDVKVTVTNEGWDWSYQLSVRIEVYEDDATSPLVQTDAIDWPTADPPSTAFVSSDPGNPGLAWNHSHTFDFSIHAGQDTGASSRVRDRRVVVTASTSNGYLCRPAPCHTFHFQVTPSS